MANLLKVIISVLYLLQGGSMFCQEGKREKMLELEFLVGDWIGTSTTIENGDSLTQVSAFEKIRYDLDSTILVIDLNGALLQLHTIIYYSETDQTYYYQPFSKNGTAIYPATFKDGSLIVQPSEEKRFVFTLTHDGKFMEYGEKLVNGVWVKYFEDIFINTQ
ncbi:MAG: hypothetical protein AAF193_07705 [Bacteroidota bacterium]